MIQKSLNSLVYALKGLKTTWVEENSFRIGVIISLLVSAGLIYFKFTFIESTFCVLAMVLVLSAEIVNTAIEDLCNKVEPQHDYIIAKIKDTMAGFVLLSVLGALVIGVLVFYSHFY